MRAAAGAALILLAAAVDAGPRVASFSPGATRTLIDLGVADDIAAATRWCPLPATHAAARSCDAFAPDMERLKAARPEIVIVPRSANPLWPERCRKEGFRTVILSPESPDSVAADIRLIGAAVGCAEKAEALASRLGLAHSDAGPRRNIAIIWGGVTAGPQSYLAGPLRDWGYTLVPTKGSWSRLDWEEMTREDIAAIVWIEESEQDGPLAPSSQKLALLRQMPALERVRAVQSGSVYAGPSGSDWLPGSGLLALRQKLGAIPR